MTLLNICHPLLQDISTIAEPKHFVTTATWTITTSGVDLMAYSPKIGRLRIYHFLHHEGYWINGSRIDTIEGFRRLKNGKIEYRNPRSYWLRNVNAPQFAFTSYVGWIFPVTENNIYRKDCWSIDMYRAPGDKSGTGYGTFIIKYPGHQFESEVPRGVHRLSYRNGRLWFNTHDGDEPGVYCDWFEKDEMVILMNDIGKVYTHRVSFSYKFI